MNVLDLGYFASIQALQYQHAPKNIDDLISVVEASFEMLDCDKLNHVFLTLQACMIECMKSDGDNGYKLPHMGKGELQKNAMLPHRLTIDPGLVARTREMIGQANGVPQL